MTSEWETISFFQKMLEVYLYNFLPKILEKTEKYSQSASNIFSNLRIAFSQWFVFQKSKLGYELLRVLFPPPTPHHEMQLCHLLLETFLLESGISSQCKLTRKQWFRRFFCDSLFSHILVVFQRCFSELAMKRCHLRRGGLSWSVLL